MSTRSLDVIALWILNRYSDTKRKLMIKIYQLSIKSTQSVNSSSIITSCNAPYSRALWAGLSCVSAVIQHWQKSLWLTSAHWRPLSTAGDSPECKGLSLHRFSMVSCQSERNAGSQINGVLWENKTYFKRVYSHWCPLISWIIFGKPKESVEKFTKQACQK